MCIIVKYKLNKDKRTSQDVKMSKQETTVTAGYEVNDIDELAEIEGDNVNIENVENIAVDASNQSNNHIMQNIDKQISSAAVEGKENSHAPIKLSVSNDNDCLGDITIGNDEFEVVNEDDIGMTEGRMMYKEDN